MALRTEYSLRTSGQSAIVSPLREAPEYAMKIPLFVSSSADAAGSKAQQEVLEQDILSCKRGDWTSRNQLVRVFMPLLRNLAEKRANGDIAEFNRLIDRGKQGLFKAVRRYRPGTGIHHFRLFAVTHIEDAMDRSRQEFWLKRLFSR